MPKRQEYTVYVYYSGYLAVEVTAGNSEDALAEAVEQSERLREESPQYFARQLLPNLERWEDADSTEEA